MENMNAREYKLKKKFDVNDKSNMKLKKKRLRQENSLGELTKNFIDCTRMKGIEKININEIVKKLKVKKRRIYDITNVLEGIGYIKKLAKNQICWIKSDLIDDELNEKNKNNDFDNKLKKLNKCFELEKEKEKIDLFIEEINKEFDKLIKKEETKQYAYVTYDDIKNLVDNDNNKMIAIKTPPDTNIEIIDKKNIENLKKAIPNIENEDKETFEDLTKENQIFMESQKGEISVYLILNNENENSVNYNNNENNIDLDLSQNYSNNNVILNYEGNSGKSNKYMTSFNNNNFNFFNNENNQILLQNKNEKNILSKEFCYKNLNFNS